MLSRRLLLGILTLGCTSFCLAQTTPPAGAPSSLIVKTGQKVAFLGDSITAQGWSDPGGYVHLVVAGLATEKVDIVPIPVGVSGNTSKDMLARLDKDVLSKSPDWMTLSCGVNDVWHGTNGVDLPTYKTNITSIVDQAQAKGIKVMILTATCINEDDNPLNQKLAPYNDFLRQLAKERKLPLADLSAAYWAALKATPPAPGTKLLTIDGVHPNAFGHMTMAHGILEAFGIPAADFSKVQDAWAVIPNSAHVDGGFGGKTVTAPMTLGNYLTLQKTAAAKGTTISALANFYFADACRQVFDAHAKDATPDLEKMRLEIQQIYATELVPPPTTSKG